MKKTKFFEKETIGIMSDKISGSLIGITVPLFAVTAIIDMKVAMSLVLVMLIMTIITSWPLAFIWQAIRVKNLSQQCKDEQLINAIREKRLIDVRLLLWAGANVNNKIEVDCSNPWDDHFSWKYLYPMDYAKDEEIKETLVKHGAMPCPDTKFYFA